MPLRCRVPRLHYGFYGTGKFLLLVGTLGKVRIAPWERTFDDEESRCLGLIGIIKGERHLTTLTVTAVGVFWWALVGVGAWLIFSYR